MFREMRRNRQMLSLEECGEILRRGTSGVLALSGDDGYPYAVPLSYLYEDGKIWFHCAREGHKLDALKNSAKASFCVIAQDEILPEKYTTCYRSVIVFGKVRILTDEEEMLDAIRRFMLRYFPEGTEQGRQNSIDTGFGRMYMLELTCEHMTGKEGLELTRQRS